MEIEIVGIDLGKTLFHLVGLDATGRVVVRKRCSRAQLLAFTVNIRVQRIGMEACSGAHLLARTLQQQGHDVRLMPAQYVKPYVKINKSDYIDAEAIAEAVQRPSMRFVPVKTEEQLDLQAVHRIRERWVMRRTAVINQIRGLLLERGSTERAETSGRSAAGHPRLRTHAVLGMHFCTAGEAPDRTRSTQRAYRENGCTACKDLERERSLPATDHNSEAIAHFYPESAYAASLSTEIRERAATRLFRPPKIGAKAFCPHCGAPNAASIMDELFAFVCTHCGESVIVEPSKVQ